MRYCCVHRNRRHRPHHRYRRHHRAIRGRHQTFDGTAAFLRSNALGPAELIKAIIGAVGELYSPQTPEAKGYTSMLRYMLGVTEAERQLWRDQVLATTAADFASFADRLERVADHGSVAVVGSDRSLADANAALPEGAQLHIRQLLGGK